MNNNAIGRNWDEVRAELFTPEEIAASDLRVALIGELIKARQEKGISQKKLEEMSGVRQPIIARMEKGTTSPQLETVLKVLAPLGMTLAIVPLSANKPHTERERAHLIFRSDTMSNREKCLALLESFNEVQLSNIAAMLQAARNAIDEAADDAFCNALYEEYKADPDKGGAISLEDAARSLGIADKHKQP